MSRARSLLTLSSRSRSLTPTRCLLLPANRYGGAGPRRRSFPNAAAVLSNQILPDKYSGNAALGSSRALKPASFGTPPHGFQEVEEVTAGSEAWLGNPPSASGQQLNCARRQSFPGVLLASPLIPTPLFIGVQSTAEAAIGRQSDGIDVFLSAHDGNAGGGDNRRSSQLHCNGCGRGEELVFQFPVANTSAGTADYNGQHRADCHLNTLDKYPAGFLPQLIVTPAEIDSTPFQLAGKRPAVPNTTVSQTESASASSSASIQRPANQKLRTVRDTGELHSVTSTTASTSDPITEDCILRRRAATMLNMDTPRRVEIADHGLERHPHVAVLGRGAYGTVVLACKKGRQVAVKVVRGRDPTPGELLARRLRHPHVLTVFGVYGLQRNFSTVEMEYCGELTLQRMLNTRSAPLSQPETLRYGRQLCDALLYCHGEGVMHLDVKPANVIVTADNDVKLTDFGSARSVNDPSALGGDIRGTVPYMAPELFQGARATCAADIYSLAVCIWQMLSGRQPFAQTEVGTIIYMTVALRVRPQPQLPNFLNRWQHVLDECWQHDPALRPCAAAVDGMLHNIL